MNAYDVLRNMRTLNFIDEGYFTQLIYDFKKDYLLTKQYEEKVALHRNPVEFKQKILKGLFEYHLKIQSREEMHDFDKEENSTGYVNVKIMDIWISDKRITSQFESIQEYCKLRSKDINIIAVHYAEFLAIDTLIDEIRLSIFTEEQGVQEANDAGTSRPPISSTSGILLDKGPAIAHETKFTYSQSNATIFIQMDTDENKYLTTLYLKTRANPELGEFTDTIGKIISLNRDDISPVTYQLEDELYIKKTNFIGKVAITGKGIKYAREILKSYNTTTIKFETYMIMPPTSKMVVSFMYSYQLTKPGQLPAKYYIDVCISDFVSRHWNLASVSEDKCYELPLLHARDMIMEKIFAGTLGEHEEFEILMADLENIPSYTLDDTIPIYDAEFYVFQTIQVVSTLEVPHEQVPELIVQTRDVINILFKKKYKKELLQVPQHENIIDLTKGATTREEFTMRLISLSATLGEMNVDLLRSLTGIKDPEVRAIQLLKRYLTTLNSDVDGIIKPMQNIVTIRNGFPAHKNKAETLKAYDQLGIAYPVIQYSESWKILLNQYLTALQKLKELIQSHFLPTA